MSLPDGAAVVLDAQAFSLLGEPDFDKRRRMLLATLKAYEDAGRIIALSVVTLAEQRRSGAAGQRLAWWRSQLVRVPVTEEIALTAARLLETTGLDGHSCVVDALVVATAATTTEQAAVLSSDASHMPLLCEAASHLARRPVTFKNISRL